MLDVRRVEGSARKRDNTWAKPRDQIGARRMRNTMGYQVRGQDVDVDVPVQESGSARSEDEEASSNVQRQSNRCIIG